MQFACKQLSYTDDMNLVLLSFKMELLQGLKYLIHFLTEIDFSIFFIEQKIIPRKSYQ